MTATDHSHRSDAEFRARIARFEAAPAVDAGEEATIERMARAMYREAIRTMPYDVLTLNDYRRLAVAALREARATTDETQAACSGDLTEECIECKCPDWAAEHYEECHALTHRAALDGGQR